MIEDFEKLNSAQVKVHFKDIYLYHDLGEEDSTEDPELICHGEWNLKWTYSYKPHVKKYKVHKKITRDKGDYTLTSVEISTLGLKVNGTTNILKTAERDSINIEKIILKDGSEFGVSQNSTGGAGTGIIPGTYHLEGYVMSYEIGQVLDEDNVSAIVVDGTTVEL